MYVRTYNNYCVLIPPPLSLSLSLSLLPVQLTLVDKTDVSWWTMKSASGKDGLVPVNYMDKLEAPDEKVASNSPTHHPNGTSVSTVKLF